MRDHLLVFVNGKPVRVGGAGAFQTLSDFLRRENDLTGTKVVCAEGDCGACAVMIGRRSAADAKFAYGAICSCILRMFQLDGAHVVTVEGLCHGEELNPIQESMVACHGAQCGFCTPGIVVSLHDLMEKRETLTPHDVRRGLVGNLCRCTGYDSIIRAAMGADRSKFKGVEEMYPSNSMRPVDGEVNIAADGNRVYKPSSLAGALRFLRENPGCLIVAGATDLGVQCNKGTRQLTVVMSLMGLEELAAVFVADGMMRVGATATLSALEEQSANCLPELSRFLAWFGSPLIKNAGTLAGNLVNASPIADTAPALYALKAEVEIASESGTRTVPVQEFHAGYRKTTLAAGELVTAIRIPLPAERDIFKLYKVSRRKDLDIASFGAAIWMRMSGRAIADIRIAYGGVAPTILRMEKAEDILRGHEPSLELFEQAGQAARKQVSPISDVRGSADYRATLAENILVKFWHDLSSGDNGDDSPTPGSPGRSLQLTRSPKADAP